MRIRDEEGRSRQKEKLSGGLKWTFNTPSSSSFSAAVAVNLWGLKNTSFSTTITGFSSPGEQRKKGKRKFCHFGQRNIFSYIQERCDSQRSNSESCITKYDTYVEIWPTPVIPQIALPTTKKEKSNSNETNMQ